MMVVLLSVREMLRYLHTGSDHALCVLNLFVSVVVHRTQTISASVLLEVEL